MVTCAPEIEIRQTKVPDQVLEAIRSKRFDLHYSNIEAILLCHCYGTDSWLGVVGDPENGGYEWFTWTAKEGITMSNVGFGDSSFALREVVMRAIPDEGHHQETKVVR